MRTPGCARISSYARRRWCTVNFLQSVTCGRDARGGSSTAAHTRGPARALVPESSMPMYTQMFYVLCLPHFAHGGSVVVLWCMSRQGACIH